MSVAPPRPDEAPAQRRRERRWLPALAVVAVVTFVTGGSQLVGRAVSGHTPPVRVAGVVGVSPDPGWEVVSTQETAEGSQVLLRHGSAGLLVVALPGASAPAPELARGYVDVLTGRFAQLTVGDASADAAGRVSYGYVGITDDGVAVEGVVVAIAGPSGAGAVLEAFAPKGDLVSAIDDLRRMIETVEVS